MFEPLVKLFINEFHKRGDEAIKTICSLPVPSHIMLMRYKTIEPILDEQRDELMMYAKELFPEKPDSELENVIKIIHTIGTLL